MRTSFDKSVKFIMSPDIEGGYVNNPKDPGGETKYGISKKWYPKLDIKNLTPEHAVAIYLKDYWLIAGCDALPWPLDLVVFDTAINNGMSVAKRFLKITDDWAKYLVLRLILYNKIVIKHPERKSSLEGWQNRITKVKKFAEKV